jgi:hypothetical protein
MNTPSHLCPSSVEAEALRDRWVEGAYQPFQEYLRGFLRQHRRFLAEQCANEEPESALDVAKSLVVENGCVDLRSEMRDQLQAIHDELWYRGEEGQWDREAIVERWTREHAPAWRRWRTMEYLFVLEQMVDELMGVISKDASPSNAA